MKAVIMKYLDNLIAWGGQLFRRDSIESINEATQLYVLAGQVLGKLPVETEAKEKAAKSFNELVPDLTQLGNAWVELELPTEFHQFDYDSISDVLLHMSYTAREGGDALKQNVNIHVNDTINKWLDSKKVEDLYLIMSYTILT